MKIFSIALAATLIVPLSGCSVQDLATTATDAAACAAAESTITATIDAYNSGLVDSGVIAQLDILVGAPVRALLSSQLAADFAELTQTLSATDGAVGATAKLEELQASIAERCIAVGVEFGSNEGQ
jgi:hypothetical protein